MTKRTKCKRCKFPLSIRERVYYMGYCTYHYKEVEEERKKNWKRKRRN